MHSEVEPKGVEHRSGLQTAGQENAPEYVRTNLEGAGDGGASECVDIVPREEEPAQGARPARRKRRVHGRGHARGRQRRRRQQRQSHRQQGQRQDGAQVTLVRVSASRACFRAAEQEQGQSARALAPDACVLDSDETHREERETSHIHDKEANT